MFYRYEHYMSISHMALIANMVHIEPVFIRVSFVSLFNDI